MLIVDDSRMARLMLRNAVESLGHETLEACDGQQAWDILAQAACVGVGGPRMTPGGRRPEPRCQTDDKTKKGAREI